MEKEEEYDLVPKSELLSSMNDLTRCMDAMFKLFKKAAEEIKVEEEKEANLSEKLDEIVDQNKAIAEGMVVIYDMVKEVIEKHKQQPEPSFPKPDFPQHIHEPPFHQPPTLNPTISEKPPLHGPVAMPAMPFSNIHVKPKKKGMFGRLKK